MTPTLCQTCQRDPALRNHDRAECSHVACPFRRSAWSERVATPSHWQESTSPRLFDERDGD